MHHFLSILFSGRSVRNVALLAIGTALGQAIAIAAAPVLTRLYTPGDFGTLGVYASLLGILSVMASLRYELAIPLPENQQDAAALAVLSLALIPIVTSALGLAIWYFRVDLLHSINSTALEPYLWLVPIGVGLIGVYQVFTFWAIRNKAYYHIARTRLSQGIASATLQVALFGFGPLGLLAGHVLGSAAGTGTLVAFALRRDRRTLRAVNLAAMGSMATRYRRFPQVATVSGLVNSSGLFLPVLLFAAHFDPFVAGQFALVQRVVTWPMNLLGNAVAQVYLSDGVAALRTSPATLRVLFLRTSKSLAMVAVVPFVALLIAGPSVFSYVFGSSWSTAGQFARLLAPMVAAQLVASPLSQTLYVLEHQTWQLAWDFLRLASAITSLTVTAYLGCSPFSAVAAYASAMFLCYSALWALQLFGISRSIKTRSITTHTD